MNLLYDYSIFQLQRYGGISRYFYELVIRLSENQDAKVNSFEGFHINEYNLSSNREIFESYRGCKIPSIKYTGHIFEILNQIWFKSFYSKSSIDIYHPTYYRSDLDKFKKTAIVLTVYDMIHELYPDQFTDSISVIKTKKKAIRTANVIIAISENTKKDLIRIYDVPESTIKVIYLASSLQSSNPIALDELKKEHGVRRPYILYVGDRRAYKNFNVLLDSFINNLSDDLDLICFGGGKFKANELKNINNRIKNSIIQLNGSDDLLASLYKHAFCFVYPSLYEGFGIPPLEAMSMGCPVIASNASSIPEVVGDAAILFDPHSKDELIDSIESLYDESKRNDLIKRGFEQEKKFSWDKMANETLEIYKSIL